MRLPGRHKDDPYPKLVEADSGTCSCCHYHIGSGAPVVVEFDDLKICGECACNVLMLLAPARPSFIKYYIKQIWLALEEKTNDR